MAGANWAESVFTESVKGAFGVTGTIFGVIGAVVASQLPQGNACALGVISSASAPCGLDAAGKVDVPVFGWMPFMTAVGVLGFVGVLVGLAVGGVGYLMISDAD